MVCNVCYNMGTYGGCWKCGKTKDKHYNGGNFSCRSCGWDLDRDGDTPKEQTIEYITIPFCPKCGKECSPFNI